MNNYFVDTHCHVFKSDYENIDEVLKNAIATREGQTITLFSDGFDEKGDLVSKFQFTWSFKLK